jgi:adenylyltransferase/sulfurtransferase
MLKTMDGDKMNLLNQEKTLSKKSVNLSSIVNKRISIIGTGGIGSHLAENLVRMGFNHIMIMDADIVEDSNISRQTFSKKDIEHKKGFSLMKRLLDINPDCNVVWNDSFLEQNNTRLLDSSDIILDATDNLSARYIINSYSVQNNVPWIYNSAIGTRYSIALFDPNVTPCFECVYGPLEAESEESCSMDGIIVTTLLEAVSKQINLCLKALSELEVPTEILQVDTWEQKQSLMNFQTLRDDNCSTCNQLESKAKITLRINCRGNSKDVWLNQTHKLEEKVGKTFELKRKNELFSEYMFDHKRVVVFYNRKATFHHFEREEVLSFFK